MIKLSEAKQAKNDYTKQASDVVRQLAFAGIAVVWLLKTNSAQPIGADTLPALIAFVTTLGLDLMHYSGSSLIWIIFYNHHQEEHKSDDAMVDVPGPVNWFGYGCFWLKVLALLIGWGLVLDAAVARWRIF